MQPLLLKQIRVAGGNWLLCLLNMNRVHLSRFVFLSFFLSSNCLFFGVSFYLFNVPVQQYL